MLTNGGMCGRAAPRLYAFLQSELPWGGFRAKEHRWCATAVDGDGYYTGTGGICSGMIASDSVLSSARLYTRARTHIHTHAHTYARSHVRGIHNIAASTTPTATEQTPTHQCRLHAWVHAQWIMRAGMRTAVAMYAPRCAGGRTRTSAGKTIGLQPLNRFRFFGSARDCSDPTHS